MSKSSKLDRPYLLRGYLRRLSDGKWMGVCLTLNLVVKADSREHAKTKLEDLIEAYVSDAIAQDEIDEYVPRHAPLLFYIEYLMLKLGSIFKPSRQPSLIFRESRQLRHA